MLDVTFERRENQGDVGLRLDAQGAPAGEVTRETVVENRVVASLIVRMGADDPIKRALGFLFGGPERE